MKTFDTLPGESNTSIISSIINLGCPQCGGTMSEFNVNGDAAETGLPNGNGRIRRRESQGLGSQAMLPGACAKLSRVYIRDPWFYECCASLQGFSVGFVLDAAVMKSDEKLFLLDLDCCQLASCCFLAKGKRVGGALKTCLAWYQLTPVTG
jgi:hypothetical protein